MKVPSIKTGLTLGLLLIALTLHANTVLALEDLIPLMKTPGRVAEEAPKEEMPEAYKLVLEIYQEALGENHTQEEASSLGLSPLVSSLSAEERQSLGYALLDLNEDGREELMIGYPSSDFPFLFQLFTMQGGNLALVFTGTEKDSLYLLSDHTLLREGYTSFFATYALHYTMSPNGYVSMEKGILYVPHIATGPYYTVLSEDLDTSKAIPLSEEDFFLKLESYEKRILTPDYEPILKEKQPAKTETGAEEEIEEELKEETEEKETKGKQSRIRGKSKKDTEGENDAENEDDKEGEREISTPAIIKEQNEDR